MYKSDVKFARAPIDTTVDMAVLEAEPPLAGVSPNSALKRGGPLAKELTEHALTLINPTPTCTLCVDVRVQRLAVGITPKPWGWHADNVPVRQGTNRPDLGLVDPSILHCSIALSTNPEGVSFTEFLQGPFSIDVNTLTPTWDQVDEVIRSRTDLETTFAGDGTFAIYNSHTLHRAAPAHRSGGRLFFRMASRVTGAEFERTMDDDV